MRHLKLKYSSINVGHGDKYSTDVRERNWQRRFTDRDGETIVLLTGANLTENAKNLFLFIHDVDQANFSKIVENHL